MRPQPLEALRRVGRAQSLVEEERQRPLERLACPPVRVDVVAEQRDQIRVAPSVASTRWDRMASSTASRKKWETDSRCDDGHG